MRRPKGFYVYAYLRHITSKNGIAGSPYYIGKGKNYRLWESCGRTWASRPNDDENIQLISEGMSEPDAFQLEMLLIYFYGRLDLGTGCLRNLTDGGDGRVGGVHSEEWKKLAGERSKKRWQDPAYKENYRIKISAVAGRKWTMEQRKKKSEQVRGVKAWNCI